MLDLRLPDMSGFEVLEQLREDKSLSDVPVVVFTGREFSAEEDAQLHTMARSIVVKGVESPNGCSTKRRCSCTGHHRPAAGKAADAGAAQQFRRGSGRRTVLLVDDDARNIFALSSVLERRGMHVLTATTGREAIAMLE